MIKIILALMAIVVLVYCIPFAILWVMNVLFHLNNPLDAKHWLVAFGFVLLFGGVFFTGGSK